MNIQALISTSVCGLLLAALPAQAGVHGNGYGQKPIATTYMAPSACTLHTYCAPQQTWAPAHFEQLQKQVWIPGQAYQVWVPPVYEQHCGLFGVNYKVLVSGGHFTTKTTPGHNKLVLQNVHVAGKWETTCQVLAAPVIYPAPRARLRAQYNGFQKPFQSGTKFQGYGASAKHGGTNIGGYVAGNGLGFGVQYGGGFGKKKGGASW